MPTLLSSQVTSQYAEVPPVIDGVLDEALWQKSPTVTGFKTFVPDFSQDMPFKTVAYMAHDEDNLYFAFKCFDDPDLIKTSIAARDRIGDDDWVCINLDSFNGGQSLYGLYVNPNGIQMDTRFAAGAEDIGLDLIWYSAAKIVDDGYVVEAKIPFKSIRYSAKDGEVEMGVIFERKISRFSMQGTFPELDPQRGFAFLTQMMPLNYKNVRKSQLVEVLPAITYASGRQQVEGAYQRSDNFEPSLTTKVGITSELVWDATINPDFSQVESDAGQVEVNQRFAINYPERRPFFLEGNENFNFAGTNGFAPIRQAVNTRSIVSPRMATKLTGKIGKKNIISTIYAQDRADERLSDYDADPTADVGVLRYMRSFSQDSYLGLIGTTRSRNGAHNTVYGFDGQYRLKESNIISGHFLNSATRATAGADTKNLATGTIRLERDTRNFNGHISLFDIAEGFRSDVGFVTRTGISRLTASVSPKLYPEKGLIKRIDPLVYLSVTNDKPSGLNESVLYMSLGATLPRNTRISISGDRSTEIYNARKYRDGSFGLSVSSQMTKRIFFRTNYGWDNAIYYSTEEQGYGKRISNSLNLQLSDKFNAEFTHTFNSLYNEETDAKYFDVHIVRGRIIYQANQYLFFRAIAQYNSLSEVFTPNFLISFTYIPGTVVHLGWSGRYEKVHWDGQAYVANNEYLETASGFFFKASFLWRW